MADYSNQCRQAQRDLARLRSQSEQLHFEVDEHRSVNLALLSVAQAALFDGESACRTEIEASDALVHAALCELHLRRALAATMKALQADPQPLLRARHASFAVPAVAAVLEEDAKRAAVDAKKEAEVQLKVNAAILQQQQRNSIFGGPVVMPTSPNTAAASSSSSSSSSSGAPTADVGFFDSLLRVFGAGATSSNDPGTAAASAGNDRSSPSRIFGGARSNSGRKPGDEDSDSNRGSATKSAAAAVAEAAHSIQREASLIGQSSVSNSNSSDNNGGSSNVSRAAPVLLDNPNQLGEHLVNMSLPHWYPARCLSAAIRAYFAHQVTPQVITLAHSQDEENFASVASQAVRSFVAGTSDTLRSAGGKAATVFSAMLPSFLVGDKNSGQQQQQQHMPSSPALTTPGGRAPYASWAEEQQRQNNAATVAAAAAMMATSSPSRSGASNNNNNNNNNNPTVVGAAVVAAAPVPNYVVEPLWLHMENNQIVVSAVEQSVLHPFPAFNEHNSDPALRSMYYEMSKRSAAERALREGTTAAIPIVDHTVKGGFSANDTNRIYGNSSNSHLFGSPTKAGAAGGWKKKGSSSKAGHDGSNNLKIDNTASSRASSDQDDDDGGEKKGSANAPHPVMPHVTIQKPPASAATSGNNNSNKTFSSNTPRQCRADEYRVAFFAMESFRRIHRALNFDINELVDHAQFDHGKHKWRFAGSPGKSDSCFYFFGHFVAKSLKEAEFKFLYERFLPAYITHVEANAFTLLPRFVALMSIVDNSRGKPSLQRFVIMNNVFPTRRVIERMYDLKGSTVNRDGLSGGITRTPFGAVLLKDNDLPPRLMLLGPVRSQFLLNQLKCDTDFLCSLSVLDYSLLVGVRSERIRIEMKGSSGGGMPGDDGEDSDSKKCFRSWDGGMPSLPIFDDGNDLTSARIDTFYIGLIDVLQNYSPAKRIEATAKGIFYSGGQSVVPPDQFAERIVELVKRITE